MAERGCGFRKKGGVYLVCGLSEYGKPIEDYLIDAPKPLRDALGNKIDLPRIGQVITPARYQGEGEARTMTMPPMVLDWVGANHYPNVADFIEEVRRMGMSRHVSSRLDFAQLLPGSRQLLVHGRAIIQNAEEYQGKRIVLLERIEAGETVFGRACIKMGGETAAAQRIAREHGHITYEGMCGSLWYEDIEEGEVRLGRRVDRQLPSFTYSAWSRPDNVHPRYEPGIFASLPITSVEIVDDPSRRKDRTIAKKFDATVARAKQGRLPVRIVPE